MSDGLSVSLAEFVIVIGYGMITWDTDRFIKGQYDLQITPQTEHEHVKMKDAVAAKLGLRIKISYP